MIHYNTTWDRCNKCLQFIREYYILTATTETGYEPEILHTCCGCCKGSEYCK